MTPRCHSDPLTTPNDPVDNAVIGRATQVDEDLNSHVPAGVHYDVDEASGMPAVGRVALAHDHLPGATDELMETWSTAKGAGEQPVQ